MKRFAFMIVFVFVSFAGCFLFNQKPVCPDSNPRCTNDDQLIPTVIPPPMISRDGGKD
jgi:hypothetical protein